MTILQYLINRQKLLFLILLYCIINVIVLFLYGCETEPVLYGLAIYLVLLLIVGILDYLKQARKHKLLVSYDNLSKKGLPELVPEHNLLAKDYQQIIEALEQQQFTSRNSYLQKEKALSDFYTMWVHQIKTPIAALRLLLQTSPENTFGMKNELFKIERYVDIILGYLRIDNMNQDLVLKHYSLEFLVKQTVKKYSSLFIQSKLSLQMDQLSISVLTDEKWLIFALEQLISNSIKYTPEGGIHIYTTSSQKEHVITSTLVIEDTGIGISSEDLPRIFERAFTGYNGRMDKKASGLGLYLCKTILQKLGHDITITSELKKGTCVTITFTEDLNLTKL
ncbi:MAG: sensor histidine kinase [Lachnospiraceae bacterium]|nr:sensor histidine kinase [Lachnospiraceae bacterium]